VAACYGAATVYMRWARPESSASLVVLQQVSYAVPALVIGAALPLTLFVSTLRHATAGQASIVGYLQPLGAALAGALFLGEVPEWRVVAGGVVVLAGCWMIAGRPRA
jgi:drug/metabolite transporter (DMT)-like permease